MLPDLDFIMFIHGLVDSKDADGRSVLSRIALNALYDAEEYPVDIREILTLSRTHGALAMAFLTWCSLNPTAHQSWSELSRQQLEPYLKVEKGRNP